MISQRTDVRKSEINGPFPSSLVPLFQNESKCGAILMKMTLICMKLKLYVKLIFALRLVLKQRHKITHVIKLLGCVTETGKLFNLN